MKHHKIPFNKLIENYVFSVSKKYIEEVGEDAQNKLINLFIHVGNEPHPEPVAKPISRRRSYRDERIKTIEHLISIHQACIDATRNYILFYDQLLSQVSQNIVSQERRCRLTSHYQSLKTKYMDYLTKLQEFQQLERSKLQT
ncbi:hypothetical protein [Spirosoma validum]|uniref:Uncharacterized protein n=1 Tax=Spirosoma validum TaxID=2771355 RepID=A0A927B6P9_9BACT|nr:hypothetical protein [Spirosoma validum]MBD2756389.1 hypothetical protein [Spirosoma validum]